MTETGRIAPSSGHIRDSAPKKLREIPWKWNFIRSNRKNPYLRIRFSFGKTTAQNVTKEKAPRVISRKIRVGMTFSAELTRNCADEIAHSLLLDESQRPTQDIVQLKRAIGLYVHFPYILGCIYISFILP